MNCPSCGAPVSTSPCGYCGRFYGPSSVYAETFDFDQARLRDGMDFMRRDALHAKRRAEASMLSPLRTLVIFVIFLFFVGLVVVLLRGCHRPGIPPKGVEFKINVPVQGR